MYNRRTFIQTVSQQVAYSVLAANGLYTLSSCGNSASKEEKKQAEKDSEKNKGKLGIALVGLGKYSEEQLAPALKETQNCYLAGIVTGTPDKIDKWKRKYDIPDKNIYSYDNFDSIKDNPDIDIIYVVLPNSMHAEYTERAFAAGKHVICEKPMALTVEECDRMIAASKKAGKMLSIGYRLHFEPYNVEMMRLGADKPFGSIKSLKAENGMNGTEGWRLDKKLAGGGPLPDVGVYCIQGIRYTTGMEPIAVRAQEGPKKDKEMFKEVEASLSWQMEMPGGVIAHCKSSYEEDMNLLRADAEKGWFELSPAYPYSGQKGETSQGKMDFPKVNQQALQMDNFAQSIIDKRPTPVPGEMGRQDVKIINAIYEAMETGKRVVIPA
ncbi:Gfo/Idh/MocA family protein [Siphonobacter sp. SORGH_AS_1065]|nr:Gfo/Idh/MocA family oxidoreductase [Siphonobacter sp. SORGH_AS_1065]